MLRLRLLQKTARSAGLAHYLATRQQQRRALQSSLPVHFLQKLGLARKVATTRVRRNWVAREWPEQWMAEVGNPIDEETLLVQALTEETSEAREQHPEDKGGGMVERPERVGQKALPLSPTSVPAIAAKTNLTEVAQPEMPSGADPIYASSELASNGAEATTVEHSNFGQFVEAVAMETGDEVIAAPTFARSSPILLSAPVPASQKESSTWAARDELSRSFSSPSQEESLLQVSDEATVNEVLKEVEERAAQPGFVQDSETLLPRAAPLPPPPGGETEAALSPPPPAVGKRRQRAIIEEVSLPSIATSLPADVQAASPKAAQSETASRIAEEETETPTNVTPGNPVSSFPQKLEATAWEEESAERDNRTPAYWHARLVAAAAREQQQTTTAPSANRTHGQASSATMPELPTRDTARNTATRAGGTAKSPSRVTLANGSSPATPQPFMRPRPVSQAAVAAPLSSVTRRFLKPLLGFDPASTPLYHNEAAMHWTRSYQADALTDGEAIAIRSDYRSDSPEFLGVLAHELTHVVRRQQPRFVPPIARAGNRQTRTFVTPELMDEEQIAHRVESRVRQTAQSVETPLTLSHSETTSASTRKGTDASASSQMPEHTSPENWGRLPAPWEPMPEMIAPVSAGIRSPFSQPQVKSVGTEAEINTTPVHTMFSPSAVEVAGAAPAPIQLAKEGRSLDEEGTRDSPADDQPQVQPDLDDLARQVYSVLKRRLAAERRREYLV